MMITIGMGIAAVVLTSYMGRKGWVAFHRAVGITPGKMTYVEPSLLPPPAMIQLQLSDTQLSGLPQSLVNHLQRIDQKADRYQQWKNDMIHSGRQPLVQEDEFVVQKLLEVRLPEILDSYQRISRHQVRLTPSNDSDQTSDTLTQQYATSNSSINEALNVLIDVMKSTERKLDALIAACEHSELNDMQAMRRYIDGRQ